MDERQFSLETPERPGAGSSVIGAIPEAMSFLPALHVFSPLFGFGDRHGLAESGGQSVFFAAGMGAIDVPLWPLRSIDLTGFCGVVASAGHCFSR
jgi:hypothetical protein